MSDNNKPSSELNEYDNIRDKKELWHWTAMFNDRKLNSLRKIERET